MEEELVTIDKILGWLKSSVEQKRMVDAHTWVDAANKLNILIGDEHDKLFQLQQTVAKLECILIDDPDTSATKARTRIKATDEFKEMKKQEARIKQIEEFIRISKLQARLKDNEYRNQ